MLGLPFGHPGRDFRVVLGQLAELTQHVLLGGAGGLGDQGGGAEELARRITAPLHLEYPSHLPVVGDGERDEHDHSPGQHASEGEDVWAHAPKLSRERGGRKRDRAERTDCVRAGDR
jgi:hypothetical protein